MTRDTKESVLQVKDVMTPDPACCKLATSLREAAELIIEHDCGEIPVVYSAGTMRPIGVITDRDITCRTIAQGKNPLGMAVGDCMSTPCVILSLEASLEDCCRAMVENLVRRIPVVDESGRCCGIVSQADIARTAEKTDAAKVVKHLSQPKAMSPTA